jgi:zinc transport system ATP-binding protein
MNQPIITAKNLSYSINNQPILEDIGFEIFQGEYIGLLGPNGGGKTTLIKIILGIIQPTTGVVQFFDQTGNEIQSKDKIGYVPQRINSGGVDFPATVSEVVASGLANNFFKLENQTTKIRQALKTAQIEHLENRLISDLSGGERQKVFIARSLISDPAILILDEPTVAIDLQSQINFYSFLRDLNKNLNITILLISHDISAVANEVSKIYFLNRTLNCYHSSKEFLDEDNLEKLYGKNINLISHHH